MKTTTNKLEKSEVEILGTIESTEFEAYEGKALARIGERLELPGFRKGKAPVNVVKENVPEMELLEEMAEVALSENYQKILEENKIDAIGHPQIAITKIGKGADLEFKIKTATLPEIKLGDYKKIAKEANSKNENNQEVVVEDSEVEKVINELRKMRAEQNKNKDGQTEKDNHQGHEHMSEEEHAKAHDKDNEVDESKWPAFDDEFVKSFGDFKNKEDFREKIKSNLKIEKETTIKDKLRLAIVEELVKQTEIEIPEILIKSETDKILYKLQADIVNAGLNFEDYLKQIAKSEDDLRKEWHGDAEKRAKLHLIIQTISKKENLKPTEEEIERDVSQIVKMYKDADPMRARAYVEQMLENEKVFKFLEEQK
jgi:trigger factor